MNLDLIPRVPLTLFDRIEAAKLTQKEYLELCEDTDWNCYKSTEEEHLYLKKNIGFAIFGPPTVNNVLGYTEDQAKKICELYRTICNNHFLINTSELHLRIIYIYICFESDKVGDRRIPLFVLKKCVCSNNSCTIFIDENSRVYDRWTEYLEDNKLPKCFMVCPLNGKYTGRIYINQEGQEEVDVLLEYHPSPACGLVHKVLNVVDTAGTVVSIGTAVVIGASTVIAVSPPILIAAGVGGIGTGIVAMGRSIYNLVDRKTHQESIGLKNSEARSCWFNTGMGAVSAVSTGATAALTRVTRNGVVVGKGTQIAFNTLSAVNILGSTANCGVTIYNVYDKWRNDAKITFMDVFQLSSSILFFQMSVTNFRTASAIIQETQTSVISDYGKTLRSNRHRKALNKAHLDAKRLKGDMQGSAETIKGIKHIKNPDEYFAGLVKMNKGLNKIGARYTINADGKAVINSVTVMDPTEFNNMSVNQRKVTLKNLPVSEPGPSYIPPKNGWLNSKITDILSFCNSKSSGMTVIRIIRDNSDTIALLLKDYSKRSVDRILNITINFLDQISEEFEPFKKIHPLVNTTVMGVQYIVEYLKKYAESIHAEITQTIDFIFNDLQNNIQDIIDSFHEWWKKQETKFYSIPNEYIEINNKQKIKKECKICKGIYFQQKKRFNLF